MTMEGRSSEMLAKVFGSLSPTTTRQAITGASARITLTPGKTYRVIADTACYLKLMSTAAGGDVATAADAYLPADQEMFLTVASSGAVTPASLKYLNVIGTAGYLHVTEMLA
jgi:hypothetical protein